ncbi:MAG: FecR family protein [Treponema sp.]|jgi:hypothetical protein|nr:FecR family protein [Treponema sp.]
MRKNRNTKSRAIRFSDAVVICACILGTAAFLVLFQKDLNRSLRRLDEEPVGFVASRSRTALRRFQDRSIWDRLQKESLVYNGDFIRTAEGSEAAIGFPGGTLVGISENSLIRVFVEADGPRIDFSGGNISVYAGESEGLTISVGGNRVKTSAGSTVTLDAGTGEEDSFNLQVIEGNASLIGPGGEQEVTAGTAFVLGGENGFKESPIAVFDPPPAARFIAPPDASVPVQFVWTGSGKGRARIEIAQNKDFSQSLTVWEGDFPKTTDASAITAAISPGTWWWRISPENAGETPEVQGQLTVLRAPAPLSPVAEAAYYYQEKPPELRFQWESSDEVLYYILEAADNSGMANPALRTEVRYTSMVYSELTEGQWYWRVTPVFSPLCRGTIPESPVIPFTIVRGDPPARVVEVPEPVETVVPEIVLTSAESPPPSPPPAVRPVNAVSRPLPAASGRTPGNGYVVDLLALMESRTIVFRWNPVAGADAYVFTLFQETGPGVRQPVISTEGPETSYTLEDLSLLDLGRFVWQVEAVNRGSDGSAGRRGTPGENLFIVDIPQPGTPQVREPGVLYGK